MKRIIITGDNLDVQIEDMLNPAPQELYNNTQSMWFPDGVSRDTKLINGIQYHNIRQLEELRKEFLAGDQYDQAVAYKTPSNILMAHVGVDYNDETKYQIFQNQRAYFMQGFRFYPVSRYGNMYYNTVTGERTKEAKGVNPYDDWELVKDEQPVPIPNVAVACGGNYAQIYMPPWYVNAPADDNTSRYDIFIERLMNQTRIDMVREAEILRGLKGKPNPINTPRG